MRVRTLLIGAAALALVGASAGDAAWARGGGHGGGGHGGMGRGGAPSFSAGPRGAMAAAPSFRGETTGAAPNVRANTFSGSRVNAPAYRGNTYRGYAANNTWRGRDHRQFRGRGFGFGVPYYGYDDSYAYDCSYGNDYYGWGGNPSYCGPSVYGYSGDYYGAW
jgi:hypothetical protein